MKQRHECLNFLGLNDVTFSKVVGAQTLIQFFIFFLEEFV